MLRSALLILSGNAAASLLLLARNLVVAWLIPINDYGIASTFAIAMAVVEMASALGLQQQIVQAKNGEDAHFQASLQGFQVLRGVVSGAVLFICAGLIADFLNVPQAAWAYRVMALVPVLNAFVHFDVHRLNRSMVFLPVILTGAVPALLSVLAVWPLAAWYGDYKVMLYAIVVQAVATTVVSHLVARRPYRLVLDHAIMAGSLRFGWPLLVNGILMFAIFQGDKLIVGREMGMEALAIFAMGFTLTLTPTLVMAKSAQNFFLPQLSVAEAPGMEGKNRFAHLTMVTTQTHILFGNIMVVAVLFFGPAMASLLLGDAYAGVTEILTPLAVMQALRLAKGGPSTVALARGRTENAMISNIVRVLSLPLAWWAAITLNSVQVIIWIAIAAELAGLGVALYLIRQTHGIRLRPLCWTLSISFAILILAAFQPALGQTFLDARSAFGVIIFLIIFTISFIAMVDFRAYATNLVKEKVNRQR